MGFQFLSNTQEQLEQLLTFGREETRAEEEEQIRSAPALLYCYSVAKTKEDVTAERGAVTMAVALCSSSPYVTLFQVHGYVGTADASCGSRAGNPRRGSE